MIRRAHIPLVLAGLAMTGVAAAWAQDTSGNPWRVAPRTAAPASDAAEDERGFTQGYLRGFEQGYRRGAEQATGGSGGAPTANLGPPAATGSTGRGNGVLSDTPPAGLAPPRQPITTALPPVATPTPSNDHAAERSFNPKPSQWGEYPPLDTARTAPAQPAPRRPAAGAYPVPSAPYPYPAPPAHHPAYAQPPAYATPPGYAPSYGAPYPYGGYGSGYGYATPYASPYAGGPTTLGTPFGGAPVPGMPGLGGPGMGFW